MASELVLPSVIVVCGDPGGAHAVAPVIEKLRADRRVTVQAFAYRQARTMWAKRKIKFDELAEGITYPEIIQLLRARNPQLLMIGTSFNSVNLEKQFIAAAREIGVPSLAVLDFWSSYAQRFGDSDGRLRYMPDQIAVMDERARDEMIGEGFPPSRLVITGQPAFDDLMHCRTGFDPARRREIREALSVKSGELLVLFASQPLSILYGTDEGSPLYPGFSEQTVLPVLVTALDQIARERGQAIALLIRPHPREDSESFTKFGAQTIRAIVSQEFEAREVAMTADLVTGMNTVLLVEACYLGCVTVSLQPGLRSRDALPTNAWEFSRGVYRMEDIKPALEDTLFDQGVRATLQARLTNLKLDDGATQRVTELAYQMIGLG